MSETSQLIATIKQQLRSQKMTYRDVARALKLSEPSVKRLFASERLTVERLVQLSNLLGYTLAELSAEAQAGQLRVSTLTIKQEHDVVSDSKLLLVAVCSLNHWSLDDIVAYYKMTVAECIKYLLQLDKLRIIDLLPGNRIRLNVARDFDWLPGGPIRVYFKRNGLDNFISHAFSAEDETMVFAHGMYTDQARAEILEELRKLKKRFAELHETSLATPLSKRSGIGLLLAMRGWEPQEFVKLRR